MVKTRFDFGFAILSIISLLSIVSCIYVCLDLLLNGYLPCKSTKNYQYRYSLMIIIDVIFWICVTDGFIGLKNFLIFIPQIFVNENDWFYGGYNEIMCSIFSVGDIFFRIQNSLWHIIFAYNFLFILRLKSLHMLLKHQKRYYWCIIIIVRSISIRVFACMQ